MSILLGVVVPQPIIIQTQGLMQILKQLKHYLTLQTSITLSQNEYSFTITSSRKLFSLDFNNKNQFVIPKHFSYLFTHYQKIYVDNQEDLEFFDVCYECMMVVREYLPSKFDIRMEVMEEIENGVGGKGMGLAEFLENFEHQKNQEFLRRINSNFKSILLRNYHEISTHEVQSLLNMAQHFYYYKNKLAALKYLAHNQQIPKQVFAQIGEKSLNFLKELSLDEDFRNYCEKLVQKVAVAKQILINQNQPNDQSQPESFQGQSHYSGLKHHQNDPQSDFINKSNPKSHFAAQKQLRPQKNQKSATKTRTKERSPLKLSSKQNLNLNRQSQTISNQDQLKNLSVKSLLFQLRESQSLKRIAMLIEAASKINIQDQKYDIKIEKQIENICRRFIKQSYFDRYETNQRAYAKQKSPFIDESFIPTRQQVDEVSKFYQSLVSYFSRKHPSLKLPKGQFQNSKDKKTNPTKNVQINSKYKIILEQICQKIEKKYYVQ